MQLTAVLGACVLHTDNGNWHTDGVHWCHHHVQRLRRRVPLP